MAATKLKAKPASVRQPAKRPRTLWVPALIGAAFIIMGVYALHISVQDALRGQPHPLQNEVIDFEKVLSSPHVEKRGQWPQNTPFIIMTTAEWCVVCKAVEPIVLKIAGDNQVPVVMVSYLEPIPQRLAKLSSSKFINVSDKQGEIALTLGMVGVPEVFVVDANGVLRDHARGIITKSWLQQAIDALL